MVVNRGQSREMKIDTSRRGGDYTCLAKGKHRPRTIRGGEHNGD